VVTVDGQSFLITGLRCREFSRVLKNVSAVADGVGLAKRLACDVEGVGSALIGVGGSGQIAGVALGASSAAVMF